MGRRIVAVVRVAAVAGLAALGCRDGSTAAPKPLPELYEPCEGSCAAGFCEPVGSTSPTGTACLSTCGASTICPPTKDGGATLCIDGWCRPAACAGWPVGPTSTPEVVCDQGMLRPCHEVASAPCSVCPCRGAQEYCDPETDTCRPKKQHGQPCSASDDCPSGPCKTFTLSDGTKLFDGKSYCPFPTAQPCWPGDPCYCDAGACRLGCNDAQDCGDQTRCFLAPGECSNDCPSYPEICGSGATCQADGSVIAPVYACVAPAGSARPPRPEGVPCLAGTECISGICCPPATGETWGHCAGDVGC